jgi:hypothetical protein
MSTNTHATHGTILASGEIKDWIIERGTEMLRNGTSAADVAEQVARDVEDDADDHSVGFSGLPNCLGMVECDASFMDGATLNAGAVGALVDFRHPISVARAVMQRTLHILLVGDGAARFAREIKAEPRTMLTPTAEAIWWERLQALGIDQDALNILRGGGAIQNSPAQIQGAIDLANKTIYGLSGSVWTADQDRAMRVARAVDSGVLSINSLASIHLEAPFGGFKFSGIGRELGLAALDTYSESKTVFIADLGS